MKRCPEYSPATCITAGELREMGADISGDIPDCAWVPRDSVEIGEVKARADGEVMSVTINAKINAPWQWWSAKITIPITEKESRL